MVGAASSHVLGALQSRMCQFVSDVTLSKLSKWVLIKGEWQDSHAAGKHARDAKHFTTLGIGH